MQEKSLQNSALELSGFSLEGRGSLPCAAPRHYLRGLLGSHPDEVVAQRVRSGCGSSRVTIASPHRRCRVLGLGLSGWQGLDARSCCLIYALPTAPV